MLFHSHEIHSFPNPQFCNQNFVNVFTVILYATYYENGNLITLKNPKSRDRNTTCSYKLDVRGSVHRSTIHTEKSNKMQQCFKIYYSIFI
jgi:hypothetical protein